MEPLRLPRLPRREPDTHKGTYGSVLLVAGSRAYPGAAILTALGAGRAGAGLVRLALPAGILPAVVPAVPFATVIRCPDGPQGELTAEALDLILAEQADALAIGPGLGTAAGTGELVTALLAESPLPAVVDADGLNLLARAGAARIAERRAPTVLTPHPGEFARLTDGETPQGDAARADRAAALARKLGAIVVLKGHRTVVTDGRRSRTETAGNPGLATGGMGDVLTGILGALLARLPDAALAAALAVHLHARAGDLAAADLGEESVLPGDVADRIGRVAEALGQQPD